MEGAEAGDVAVAHAVDLHGHMAPALGTEGAGGEHIAAVGHGGGGVPVGQAQVARPLGHGPVAVVGHVVPFKAQGQVGAVVGVALGLDGVLRRGLQGPGRAGLAVVELRGLHDALLREGPLHGHRHPVGPGGLAAGVGHHGPAAYVEGAGGQGQAAAGRAAQMHEKAHPLALCLGAAVHHVHDAALGQALAAAVGIVDDDLALVGAVHRPGLPDQLLLARAGGPGAHEHIVGVAHLVGMGGLQEGVVPAADVGGHLAGDDGLFPLRAGEVGL